MSRIHRVPGGDGGFGTLRIERGALNFGLVTRAAPPAQVTVQGASARPMVSA